MIFFGFFLLCLCILPTCLPGVPMWGRGAAGDSLVPQSMAGISSLTSTPENPCEAELFDIYINPDYLH